MTYVEPSEIYDISGYDETEIATGIVGKLIDYAESEVERQISIRAVDEDLEPNLDGVGINGSNKTFYTKYYPIADINRDSLVNASDVIVYVWADEQDEATKTPVTVSTVDADSGRIVLGIAPTDDKERISSDYSYHRVPVNYSLVSKAITFLSAYLCTMRMAGRLPLSYTLGRALRVNRKEMGRPFLKEYYQILNLINAKMNQHVKSAKVIR